MEKNNTINYSEISKRFNEYVANPNRPDTFDLADLGYGEFKFVLGRKYTTIHWDIKDSGCTRKDMNKICNYLFAEHNDGVDAVAKKKVRKAHKRYKQITESEVLHLVNIFENRSNEVVDLTEYGYGKFYIEFTENGNNISLVEEGDKTKKFKSEVLKPVNAIIACRKISELLEKKIAEKTAEESATVEAENAPVEAEAEDAPVVDGVVSDLKENNYSNVLIEAVKKSFDGEVNIGNDITMYGEIGDDSTPTVVEVTVSKEVFDALPHSEIGHRGIDDTVGFFLTPNEDGGAEFTINFEKFEDWDAEYMDWFRENRGWHTTDKIPYSFFNPELNDRDIKTSALNYLEKALKMAA